MKLLERSYLSFPARENMKAGETVQKIAVKSGVHTENDRFFRIFEFKKTVFYCESSQTELRKRSRAPHGGALVC